jgi:23S rRNA (cytidine1920-2'-O)/16S rRNA (cytidine1409-2'-O)-methyltransferase
MARIRADILLVERGLFESRAKARAAIEAGGVTADGRVVEKPADLLEAHAELAARPAHPWVGRGAVKLDHALTIWPIAVAGRHVLDVGASTGGFTEVCLAKGAARVYAVDVGRGQLHRKVADDPRVVALEGVDARRLTSDQIPEPCGLLVCDVSFVSLTKALPPALALTAPDADLVALVKPQFELGPDDVGKGGLVKDLEAQARAVVSVAGFLQANGWSVQATAESPIRGGGGQVEFLIWAKKKAARGEAGGFDDQI